MQGGVVLVAVLWMAAALVLIVAGISRSSRVQVRGADAFRDRVVGTALADGAVMLAARQLLSRNVPVAGALQGEFDVAGTRVAVELSPATGWIDPNSATPDLLRVLFEVKAGLDEERAAKLAAAIVDWRDRDVIPQPNGAEDEAYVAAGSSYRPFNGRFQVPEDLLQVLGMNYPVFDSIRDCISVAGGGSGGVNPLAAPAPVLLVLAGGDAASVARILEHRAAGDPLQDFSGLQTQFLSSTASTTYRAAARVGLEGGRTLLRTAWLRIDRSNVARGPVTILYREPATLEREGD